MGTIDEAAPDPLADPRVFRALQDYQAELDAGRHPSHAEFVARYADVAGALAGCLRGLDLVCSGASRASSPAGSIRLGDFRVLREVGRGGMGVVYEAEQISLGRRVALKVVTAALDERGRQRFRNEGHAAASLRHPHIVPVHAVGFEGEAHFLAMQFVAGQSLAAILRRHRRATDPTEDTPANVDTAATIEGVGPPAASDGIDPLPNPSTPAYCLAAARIVAAAADALQHAHDCGIVHRDIKPGNLLLEANGHLWVADFGLARLPGVSELTRTGEVVGTLRYMSPEQAAGAAVDHRTDVYSLGATLYELVTLRPAFPGSAAQDLLARIASEEPPAPRAIAPAVPRDLETIVLKAMAKEPAERYAAAAEMADDLRRYLEDRPVLARRPTAAHRLRKWARRNRGLVAAGVAVMVAFLAFAAVGFAVSGARVGAQRELTEKANAELRGRNAELDRTVGALNRTTADLTAALRQARQAEYTYRFLAARREWLEGNFARANQLLDDCPEEFRRWEWGYLKNLGRPGLFSISGRSQLTFQLAFNRDGTRLTIVGNDEVDCWDTSPGTVPDRTLLVLQQRDAHVRVLAHDADGARLHVGTPGNQLQQRDALTGALLASTPLPDRPVAFSRDAARLVCAGSTGVHLVTVPDGKPVPGFQYAAPAVQARAEILDSVIVLGKKRGGIDLLDPATGQVRATLPDPGWKDAVLAASPNGRLVAVPTGETIRVWDLATLKELSVLRGHTGTIGALAFAPDGRRLASVGKDRTVRVWDAAAGQELAVYRGHKADLRLAAFSPDGLRLATADRAGNVVVWDATAGQESWTLPKVARMPLGAVPDGASRVVRSFGVPSRERPAVAHVYDPATGVETITPIGTNAPVAVPVEGGGGAVLTYVSGKAGKQWVYRDSPRGTPVALAGLVGEINVAALSPDGAWLVAAIWNSGTIQVVDVATGTRTFLLPGHATIFQPSSPTTPAQQYPMNVWYGEIMPVYGLAFHPRGHQFASAGMDRTVRVWDVRTGACLRTHADHAAAVFGVAYDPKGRWLASAGGDGTARLYEAETGAFVRALSGAGTAMRAVAFTPDGSRLATIGVSDPLRIWEPETGEEYLSVPNPTGSRGLSFSPDGSYLLSNDFTSGARLWDGAVRDSTVRVARATSGAKGWYEERALDAEKQKDWFAAAWHWERSTAIDPANANHQSRLQKARAALAASKEVPIRIPE